MPAHPLGSAYVSEKASFLKPQIVAILFLLFLLRGSGDVVAQQGKPKLPRPQEITLYTPDAVQLKATYYPSFRYKEAATVILLHGWGRSRADFRKLASMLHKQGTAVMLPDLRAHGGSTTALGLGGGKIELQYKRLRSGDFGLMVTQDLVAVKRFLLQKHNAGELNIEKLCIVGADLGALVGIRFAALDWSYPQLPSYKQGRDVKAVFMISPSFSFKGFSIRPALDHYAVSNVLSIALMYAAQDTADSREAKRLFKLFLRLDPRDSRVGGESPENRRLVLYPVEASEKGAGMLMTEDVVSSQAYRDIMKFIDTQVVQRELRWIERKNPLGD